MTQPAADVPEWDTELDELERRRAWAKEHGGPGAIARQRAAGRGLARERIDQLADEGSFREIGSLTGVAEYDTTNRVLGVVPANPIIGDRSAAARARR